MMQFASDNTSGVPQQVLDALVRANDGFALGYGADALTARVQERLRALFEAPQAEIRLVTTGTAANALALALLTPPWGAIWCHHLAHIEADECGAPEFYTGGAKLVHLEGAHARLDPTTLDRALTRAPRSVHQVQPSALSLSNLTECGTLYTPDALAGLCAVAKTHGLGVHLDGARFANALAATGASPAELSWKAGVDVLCLGGTKNGLMAAEAVVIFDPARAAEFDLRRKRSGHLLSKHRFVAAQFDAWLTDDLWLDMARQANSAGQRLAQGLAAVPQVTLLHPVEGNMLFVNWPEPLAQRLSAAGAAFYGAPDPDRPGRATARLVASWNTTDAQIARFLDIATSD